MIIIERRNCQTQVLAVGRLAADLAPRNFDLGKIALIDCSASKLRRARCRRGTDRSTARCIGMNAGCAVDRASARGTRGEGRPHCEFPGGIIGYFGRAVRRSWL